MHSIEKIYFAFESFLKSIGNKLLIIIRETEKTVTRADPNIPKSIESEINFLFQIKFDIPVIKMKHPITINDIVVVHLTHSENFFEVISYALSANL